MNYADKKSFPINFVQQKSKKGNLNHLKSYSQLLHMYIFLEKKVCTYFQKKSIYIFLEENKYTNRQTDNLTDNPLPK